MWAWFWLSAGALTEVGWVAGIKMANTPLQWIGTALCAAASVLLALGATRDLPPATVYTLFVGLGTLGTIALEWLVLGAALHPLTLACLAALIVCVFGLKLSSEEH